MLFAIFVISLVAAVGIGGYTFSVLFGSWAKPPKGPFVAPPPPPAPSFTPFIPPVDSAPVHVAPAPVAAPVEQATAISSVFVSLPPMSPAPQVFPPPPVARGTTANPSIAKGSMVPQPAPRAQRSAKGSVPPPVPSRPMFRNARAVQPEDFLDNEATNVDTIPTPHR